LSGNRKRNSVVAGPSRPTDPAPLALLQVSGVEPQIRPLEGERPVEERIHALVDLFAQLGSGNSGLVPPAVLKTGADYTTVSPFHGAVRYLPLACVEHACREVFVQPRRERPEGAPRVGFENFRRLVGGQYAGLSGGQSRGPQWTFF
jgi:hypothetical protein